MAGISRDIVVRETRRIIKFGGIYESFVGIWLLVNMKGKNGFNSIEEEVCIFHHFY